MPRFEAATLRRLGYDILRAAGALEEEAGLVAGFLVKSNLMGHDSHGIIRIPQYVRGVREGGIKPGARIDVVRETPSTALLNGNWGFGQVTGVRAMEIAVQKAGSNAVSAVGVFNCNHVGRLADYSMIALRNEMIGAVFCNDSALMAPFGGIDRVLGPSPMSFAVPAGEQRPIVLDMSTSVAPEGKVRVLLNRGEQAPDGWLIDRNGNPTNNPSDLYAGGALLPLGGKAGHKGFGLALIVDILGGILTGTGSASSKEAMVRGNGTFMMAINIASFTPVEEFKRKIDQLIRAVKSSRTAPGFKEILVPGEVEFREEERRLREGIALDERTWLEIQTCARELGIDDGQYGERG